MTKRRTPDILYEDSELLVCIKPAGVPVQTAKIGQSDLVSDLKNYRAKKKEDPYIGVVHRLDQPVEGVMVFAKTKRAAADLSAQVSNRRMRKEYMAVICHMDEQNAADGEIWHERKDYLIKDARTNTSKVVPEGTAGAKEARLSYRILKYNAQTNRDLIRIRLETGRHHQIRVQFAHAGMPLYGDTKYGDTSFSENRGPVALCSCGIGFAHPATKAWMEFTLDGGQRLKDALEKL